ncbi:MAG: endo alpha-1,4 polygalactosaminidase [Gaiellales bacterium]
MIAHRLFAAMALTTAALLGGASASAVAGSAPPAGPVAHGTLRIAGELRDGGTVHARGVTWHPGNLAPGQRLLSFEVAYTWQSCPSASGKCTPGAGSTSAPFAASIYQPANADVGAHLRLVETATEVVETDPATFTFRVLQASRSVTTVRLVGSYPRGSAPTVHFINGTPEGRTGSDIENFQVSPAHFNPADGVPALRYRVDGRAWQALPPSRVFSTGKLAVGPHRVSVQARNHAGASTRTFAWRVVPLLGPEPCKPRRTKACWYPPHLDRTGHPMRWDWQIGRVAPLQRTGVHAVDIYDIDGFLTTPPELRQLHTAWQAATLPHPKAVCYLDLAWEMYRPDASPTAYGGAFPARTVGRVYFGFPQERWLDVRQLNALKPMLDHRIAMCAHKGFDAVELDDMDSYDPPGETGFQLTTGDWKAFLAWAFDDVHRHGMTGLWKNSPLLSWWGRRYTEGAVVEECYTYDFCFSAGTAGSTQYGFTCTVLSGPRPCGFDDFTADTTRHQPTGKWVGDSEYVEDGFVCAPGQSCSHKRLFSTYCQKVYSPPNGFSGIRLSDNLDGSLFQPCPRGR